MRMRRVTVIIAISFLMLGIACSTGAVELSLISNPSTVFHGDDLTIDINIDIADGVAGCAFTLEYPSEVMEPVDVVVTTDFFKQVFDYRIDTNPGSATPWEQNTTTLGYIKMSGVYIDMDSDTGGGGAYTGTQTLFSVHFRVKADALPGNYLIILKQTQLCNGSAGWGSDINNNGICDPGDVPEGSPILIKAYGVGSSQWGTSDDLEILINNFTSDPTAEIAIQAHPCGDPGDADDDDDGILDEDEDKNQNGIVDDGETDPCEADSDGDGVQDGTEMGLTLDDIGIDTDTEYFIEDADPSTTTNPLDNDSDNDGLLDGEEDMNSNGAVDEGETDPMKSGGIKAMPWIPLLLMND